MFVSQLYRGSIWDKQIVTRSGFRELLSSKKEVSEVENYDIEADLKKIGLQLNISPFFERKTTV